MTLNQTIYQLLSNVTKVPIIRAFQSGAEPAKPFITYSVKWDKTPEHYHAKVVQSNGKQTISTHVNSLLELQCFGKDAVETLRAVKMALHTYSQQTKWLNAGVVLVDTGQLSDMPYLNEANAYENRAVLEIQIRHKLSIEDDIGFFNRVELTDADNQTTTIVEVENGKY